MEYRKARVLAALGLLVTSTPAFAAETSTGEQIKSAISGNTAQGHMIDGSPYAEHYQPDGTIKGKGYTGRWSVSGNSMCYAYGEDAAKCCEARLDGRTVVWIKDSEADGAAVILNGNPNNF